MDVIRIIVFLLHTTISLGRRSASQSRVPDEQRLYEKLMRHYEEAVRPVMNASDTLKVTFSLSLNQITDLEERSQVLTTNVFINQAWRDESLSWQPSEYSGIRTLRVPAKKVWLPDTFIYNNADDGFTGFVQGVFVMVNHNGTVLWPAPVKLKSSCKVDIRYFPFDDQHCVLRFGSWIYSGSWLDYESAVRNINLENYIDNSEWELMSIAFEKKLQKYACCTEQHTDLTYTLHIRRRALFYIFNIIVPCIMLSVLTLLTFWLPPTSGEKISLGLSVFLAFSMFMLLIAEEVPATSESVPLIGIYLTTVMTMTSVSVILATVVINIYSRGSKGRRAPKWLKTLILDKLSRLMCMEHDMEKMILALKLDDTEESEYRCDKHTSRRPSFIHTSFAQGLDHIGGSPREGSRPSIEKSPQLLTAVRQNGYNHLSPHNAPQSGQDSAAETDDGEEVWVIRRSFDQSAKTSLLRGNKTHPIDSPAPQRRFSARSGASGPRRDTLSKIIGAICRKEEALVTKKVMIVEWQIIATVLDRVLFWIFVFLTIFAFFVIIVIIPKTKSRLPENAVPIDMLINNR